MGNSGGWFRDARWRSLLDHRGKPDWPRPGVPGVSPRGVPALGWQVPVDLRGSPHAVELRERHGACHRARVVRRPAARPVRGQGTGGAERERRHHRCPRAGPRAERDEPRRPSRPGAAADQGPRQAGAQPQGQGVGRGRRACRRGRRRAARARWRLLLAPPRQPDRAHQGPRPGAAHRALRDRRTASEHGQTQPSRDRIAPAACWVAWSRAPRRRWCSASRHRPW